MKIQEEVKRLRLEKGLSIEELSKLSGATIIAIEKFENYGGGLFSVLVKIVNALGYTITLENKDFVIKEKVDKDETI